MKKKKIIIVLIVIIGALLIILGAKAYLETNLEGLTDLPISNVDLSKMKDGIYVGSYKAFPVEAIVKVTVMSDKIAAIELVKHSNGKGAKAEIIPSKVIEAQSLEVDLVSGATYSSKVILKAIEAALINTNKE